MTLQRSAAQHALHTWVARARARAGWGLAVRAMGWRQAGGTLKVSKFGRICTVWQGLRQSSRPSLRNEWLPNITWGAATDLG